MRASPLTVDFSRTLDIFQHATGNTVDDTFQPFSSDGKLLTGKQIRARARRKRKRGVHMSKEEMDALYEKPIDEWDLEELAHGRPRNAKGHFTGPNPQWIDRSVHEQAMEKYTSVVKTRMKVSTVDALDVLKQVLRNEDTDDRGKPIIPASTKVDVAKFLLEHVVGKPTQRVENDVSIRLQAILAQVVVNPGEKATGNYMPAHFPGATMALTAAQDLEDDYEDAEEVEE